MEAGQEWAYRVRTTAPSRRVRILAIEHRKNTTRVSIKFFVRESPGAVESVPAGRLRCLWSRVAEHEALMANLQLLGGYKLTSAEETAVWVVDELLIPEGVVTIDSGNVLNCAGIRDVGGLERLTHKPATQCRTWTLRCW